MSPRTGPAAALLGLVLLACAPPTDPAPTAPGSGDAQDPDTDSGQPTPAGPLGVEIETSPHVGTVVRVAWQTEEATRGRAHFVANGEDQQTPWTDPGTAHEVLLLGLHPDTVVDFSIELEDVGPFDGYAATTDPLPAGFPTYSIEGTRLDGGYQVLSISGADTWVVALDTSNTPVWYRHMSQAQGLLLTAPLPDHSGLIIAQTGEGLEKDGGMFWWVDWWGRDTHTVALPFFNHDMTVLPDGSAAALRLVEGVNGALANQIVEVRPTGEIDTIWDAWVDLYVDGTPVQAEVNWTHANALVHLPEDDAYLVHLREPGSTLKIDRSTGARLWGLNGTYNDFASAAPYVAPDMQHGITPTSDGFLVFDNSPIDHASLIRALTVDEEAMTVSEDWSFAHDPPLYIYALGDVHQGISASTISWSTAGELMQLDAAHQPVWFLRLGISMLSGYLSRIERFYPAA